MFYLRIVKAQWSTTLEEICVGAAVICMMKEIKMHVLLKEFRIFGLERQ